MSGINATTGAGSPPGADDKIEPVGTPEPETSLDRVIARYKEGIDRTLIRDNLRRTHEERLIALQQMQEFVSEVRAAGEEMRRRRQ